MAAEYKIRLLWIEVVYRTDMRPVNHPEREIVQQVVEGVDIVLLGENVGSFRSNSFQVYDLGVDSYVVFIVSGVLTVL